jgi:hypothetical protein
MHEEAHRLVFVQAIGKRERSVTPQRDRAVLQKVGALHCWPISEEGSGVNMKKLWNEKCDACDKRKPDVKPRADWAPPRPMCDDCWNRWWEANKDELG